MNKKTNKLLRRTALLLSFLLVMLSVSVLTVSVSAANHVAQIITSDGTVLGSYASLTSAHNAAIKAKLDNYTLKLLDDVSVESSIGLNNVYPTTWLLDGNGKTVTQSKPGDNGLYLTGDNGATVYIRDLNVNARGSALYLESGNFVIFNGTYVTTDPADWKDSAIFAKALKDDVLTLKVYGGTFKSVYTGATDSGNNEGKLQAACRIFSNEGAKMTVDIYGGYFNVSSNSSMIVSDGVVYVGGDKDVKLNIWGGTFQTKQVKFVVQVDYDATLNMWGGNFISDITQFGQPTVANYSGAVMVNRSTAKGWFYHGNFYCGSFLIRTKGVEGTFGAFVPDPSTNTSYYVEYSDYLGTAPALPDFYKMSYNYTPEGAGQSTQSAPLMETGAALMLSDTQAGIRFTTKVNAKTVETLSALADEGTELSFGTIITGAALEGADIPTREFLESKGYNFVDVKANSDNVTEDAAGTLTYTGALVGIGESYYDTQFSAIAYVELIIDGVKVRYYSLYDTDDNTCSLKGLATKALADSSTTYTDAQRDAMSRFVD